MDDQEELLDAASTVDNEITNGETVDSRSRPRYRGLRNDSIEEVDRLVTRPRRIKSSRRRKNHELDQSRTITAQWYVK